MKSKIHLYLVPQLRMNEPVPLLFIRHHVVDTENVNNNNNNNNNNNVSFLQKNFTSVFVSYFDALNQFPALQ